MIKKAYCLAALALSLTAVTACSSEVTDSSSTADEDRATLTVDLADGVPAGEKTKELTLTFAGTREAVDARVHATATSIRPFSREGAPVRITLAHGATKEVFFIAADDAGAVRSTVQEFEAQSKAVPQLNGIAPQDEYRTPTGYYCEGQLIHVRCVFGFSSECNWRCLVCESHCDSAVH